MINTINVTIPAKILNLFFCNDSSVGIVDRLGLDCLPLLSYISSRPGTRLRLFRIILFVMTAPMSNITMRIRAVVTSSTLNNYITLQSRGILHKKVITIKWIDSGNSVWHQVYSNSLFYSTCYRFGGVYVIRVNVFLVSRYV